MPALSPAVLAVVLVVALPAIVLATSAARDLDPAWILSAGVCLSVFSGNWDHLGFPFGIDRVVTLAGFYVVLVQAIVRRRTAIRVEYLHVGLGVLTAYAVGSSILTDTFEDQESFYALFDKLGLIPFLLFLTAPDAFGTQRQRNILVGMLTGLGGYLALVGLLETVGARGFVLPRYIADPSLGIHADRARGPFLEAAAFGQALYVCGVASVIAVVTWPRPAVRRMVTLIAIGSGVAIIGTLTRQVWVAVIAATFVGLLATRDLRRFLLPAVAGGAIAVLAVFAFVPGLSGRAEERAASERPVWDRLNSNRAALAMVAESPVLGHGWHSFRAESVNYYSLSPDYPLTTVANVHNVFLSYLAELGAVGLGLFLACLVAAFWAAIRRRAPGDVERWRLGLVPVFVSWVTVVNFAPFGNAFTNAVLWLWIGVAYAGRYAPVASSERSFALAR